MENSAENINTFKLINKTFDINWEKINTIDDVKELLKCLQLQVNITNDVMPKNLRILFENGLLIERV